MATNQPIDNRDLRIFDFNVKKSLLDIADSIEQNNTDDILKEINAHLRDIATSLREIAEGYLSQS